MDYTYSISGQCTVGLSIQGNPFPINPNILKHISVVQDTRQLLPTIRVVIEDINGALMRTFPISDGTLLQITLAADEHEEDVTVWSFRVTGVPIIKMGPNGINLLDIYGILDAPLYVYKMIDKAYTGTTSEVITAVAKECNLTALVDQTNDAMTWLPNRLVMGKFCVNLRQYGWVDKHSLMLLGVDVEGILHYRNLNTIIDAKPQSVYYYDRLPKDSELPIYEIQEYKISGNSGYANKGGGYGARISQMGLSGDITEHTKVAVKYLSESINMDSDIKRQVSLTQSMLFGMDAGNTHSHYAEAKYQNRRIESTYNTGLTILTDNRTADNLLDLVEVHMIDPITYEPNEVFNGSYVIAGKTIQVSGNFYAERLRLVTQGSAINPGNRST